MLWRVDKARAMLGGEGKAKKEGIPAKKGKKNQKKVPASKNQKDKLELEEQGIEPWTSRKYAFGKNMRSEHSTPELHPRRASCCCLKMAGGVASMYCTGTRPSSSFFCSLSASPHRDQGRQERTKSIASFGGEFIPFVEATSPATTAAPWTAGRIVPVDDHVGEKKRRTGTVVSLLFHSVFRPTTLLKHPRSVSLT